MEEIPSYSPEIDSQSEPTPDPEKIGDLLLRYELPVSEPEAAPKLATEKDPKLLISRDKLRSRLTAYRQEKAQTPKAETTLETSSPPEVPEIYFERRKEAIDQNMGDETADTSSNTAQASVLDRGRLTSAPASPPPIVPPQPVIPSAQPTFKLSFVTKKPFLLGLVAGVATATVLIALYFTH